MIDLNEKTEISKIIEHMYHNKQTTSPAFIGENNDEITNSEKYMNNQEWVETGKCLRRTKTLANIDLKIIKGENLYTEKLKDMKVMKERP